MDGFLKLTQAQYGGALWVITIFAVVIGLFCLGFAVSCLRHDRFLEAEAERWERMFTEASVYVNDLQKRDKAWQDYVAALTMQPTQVAGDNLMAPVSVSELVQDEDRWSVGGDSSPVTAEQRVQVEDTHTRVVKEPTAEQAAVRTHAVATVVSDRWPITDTHARRLIRRNARGESWENLADELGISASTLRRRVAKLG